MNFSGKYIVAAIVGTVAVLIVAHVLLTSGTASPSGGVIASEGERTSTTSPLVLDEGTEEAQPTSDSGKKTLPLEPEFTLPEGAVAVDEYAFVDEGVVYMRPLINANSPLTVPSADPKTFRRLRDFSTYSDSDVVSDCGVAPIYAFYIDKHRPYFYQIWRAPKFRASQIDAMNGANPRGFVITGATTATDGNVRFTMKHIKNATSTCLLLLDQEQI